MVVLVDGVCINSVDFGLVMYQDLLLVQIECVEIVCGLQFSLYGVDVIGGVIQIFICCNQGDFVLYFQFGGGSNGLCEVSGGIGGGIECGWFGVDIVYQYFDGIDVCRGLVMLFIGCFVDEFDCDGYCNLFKSLCGGYIFNDQWNVEGSVLCVDGKNYYDGYYNYLEICQQVLVGKVCYILFECLVFIVNVGCSDNELDNFGDFGVCGSVQIYCDSVLLQGDFVLVEGQLLSIGVDWSEDNLDGSSVGYFVDSCCNIGVFVQYQGCFGCYQLQVSVCNDDNQQFGNYVIGSFGWVMEFGYGLCVNVSYGIVFKVLIFSDLYDLWSGVLMLKLEKFKSVNFGVLQQGQGWYWGLDVYEICIDDLIIYDVVIFQMQQVEKVCIRGVELIGGVLLVGFDINVQLSYIDLCNCIGGSIQFDNWLLCCVQQIVWLDIDWCFGDFCVGLIVQGVGKCYDDVVNVVKVGGYGMLDLCVEYVLMLLWLLLVCVVNVFDCRYEMVVWFNQFGCEYQLSVCYQLK